MRKRYRTNAIVLAAMLVFSGVPYINAAGGVFLQSYVLEDDELESQVGKSEDDLNVKDKSHVIFWEFSSEGHPDDSDRIWYGQEEASDIFLITVDADESSDFNGLQTVTITDNGKTIFEKTDFSPVESRLTETYTIGEFADGCHTIAVSAEDSAGNTVTDERTFWVDSVLPERGVVSAVSPESIVVDEKQWFNGEDIITFRVDCADVGSGIKEVLVRINGQAITFAGDAILSGDCGYYVIFNSADIAPDDEHQYTVIGNVTDFAENSLTLEPLTVYADLESPLITRFTVEKKYVDRDRGLNVVPSGTYANDTLVLKAYAADAEFDTGIDHVTVFYDGLCVPEVMADEGNGVFSIEIAASEEPVEYSIIATAYDIFGKSSGVCPNPEDAVTGELADSKFVMIESVKPDLTFRLLTDEQDSMEEQSLYTSNRSMELIVQDCDSGIRDVGFYVNGIDFKTDKNGVELLKAASTRLAETRDTEEHSYAFDTDYITSIVGEPDDGVYAVSVKVTDNAGNVSVYDMEYFFDKTPPQIDRIAFSPSAADGMSGTEEFVEGLTYGFFFKTDIVATVYISDPVASSGLDKLHYRFVDYQNGAKQEEESGVQKIEDGKVQLQVPQGFKGQLFVEAYDNMGNRSDEKNTKAYVIDGTAPEIHIINNASTIYTDAAGNALFTAANSITVEITDTVSGLREIGYAQSAEQNPVDRVSIVLNHSDYHVGEDLGDGWMIAAMDMNLVTKVTRTFTFDWDDNDIVLTIDATDNALNTLADVRTDMFTVDKTSPVINVSFRDDEGNDGYYNQDRIADIRVIERNFDENLISVMIENTFGAEPAFSFSQQSVTEYTAVIVFDEGDYTFDIAGRDLGDNEAVVNFSGGNEKSFSVDKSVPVTVDDFDMLVNEDTENSFNSEMTIHLEIMEHNFDPSRTQLRVRRKDPGEEHSTSGFVDAMLEVLGYVDWSSEGDNHSVSFTLSEDAVYQLELTPADLAGNQGETRTSAVFEIDRTAPIVTAKNGMPVSAEDTESVDIYPYMREGDPAPTIEFDDLNIDHLNYELTVYIPDHTSPEADTVIRPRRVYLEEDQGNSGTVKASRFVLPDFEDDGVYALKLSAVDVAGNESLLNVNTYVRMTEQDVLAYIMDSNPAQGTGLYSFQYENGVAISKRPDDFEDISIFVMAKEDTGVDIVLRDSNGDEIRANVEAVMDDSVYGVDICRYTLSADFFKENFQDDTDAQLILTVRSGEDRIDLGRMHIDNIAPTCDMPEEFRSWHWYYGVEARTITVSNISELVDESLCRVYDNGKEVPFEYSSEDNSIRFTLEKGWHNVGIILSDMAGNSYNIQEKTNIHIGFFWLWAIAAAGSALVVTGACVLMRSIGRRRAEELSE